MKLLFFISLITFVTELSAMTPSTNFAKKETFGSVNNYRYEKEDVDLSIMDTDIEYSDLSPEGMKEINAMFVAKKEYGKMFGFNEWNTARQKLFEEKGSRTLVLEGSYKDRENKTVHFLEVYWAHQSKKSGQFLVTSNSKKLSLDDYKKYFSP